MGLTQGNLHQEDVLFICTYVCTYKYVSANLSSSQLAPQQCMYSIYVRMNAYRYSNCSRGLYVCTRPLSSCVVEAIEMKFW